MSFTNKQVLKIEFKIVWERGDKIVGVRVACRTDVILSVFFCVFQANGDKREASTKRARRARGGARSEICEGY